MRSKLPLVGAVVAALIVPSATALARMGSVGAHSTGNVGAHSSFSGGTTTHPGSFARFNSGPRFNSGARFANSARFNSRVTFNNNVRFSRFGHRRFFHRRHFRGPFFVGGFAYADSCWRWGWTPFGWRRHWVCDYPYYW